MSLTGRSPAIDTAVIIQATTVVVASTDLLEDANGGIGGLPIIILPPAVQGTTIPDATGMLVTGTELNKGTRRGRDFIVQIFPPTRDGAVAAQAAGVKTARADLPEGARWGSRLTVIISSPTG